MKLQPKQIIDGEEQHYVPRLLLRAWQVKTPKGIRVWTYDFASRSVNPQSVRNIMFEENYYDRSPGGSVDPFISPIENRVAPTLARIRHLRELPPLSPSEQRMLALFVSIQLLRTPIIRSTLERIKVGTFSRPDGREAASPAEFDECYPEMTATDVQFDFLTSWSFKYAKHLFTKLWTVDITPPDAPLVISDNPVFTRHQFSFDDANEQLRQSTFYLPIDPHLVLAFIPHHLVQPLKPSYRRGVNNQMLSGKAYIDQKEVALLNECQAFQASRYLVGDSPDFSWLSQIDRRKRKSKSSDTEIDGQP